MTNYNGTSANNTWHGTSAADAAHGNGGDDKLYGAVGADTLYGDTGNDQLYGEAGSDLLNGGLGNDYLSGGSGNDQLYGGLGNDTLVGGPGNDKLFGDAGNDRMVFSYRPDYGLPNDSGEINGGAGFDTLVLDVHGAVQDPFGDNPSLVDVHLGGAGHLGIVTNVVEPNGVYFGAVRSIEAVEVTAGSNAVAVHTDGTIAVKGGDGADILFGSAGDQTFIGGNGGDAFNFEFHRGVYAGNDQVLDFSAIKGDHININYDEGIAYDKVEDDGYTVYRGFDPMSGADLGTLTVLGVDLPSPGTFEIG
jgi:Ca2+-binding RTX toxin-like protein